MTVGLAPKTLNVDVGLLKYLEHSHEYLYLNLIIGDKSVCSLTPKNSSLSS